MTNPIKARLRDSGNSRTFEVTIPRAIVEYEGFKDGDILEIQILGKVSSDPNEAANNEAAN